ncbi:uncharacterized protein [Montipora foliosa]|uniref:uncharacterized protein n=1 Tax=Montipora foliosa TaxID=591990 RepID=UPI0035F1FDAA
MQNSRYTNSKHSSHGACSLNSEVQDCGGLLNETFAELIKSIPADIINVALNETKTGSGFFATILVTFGWMKQMEHSECWIAATFVGINKLKDDWTGSGVSRRPAWLIAIFNFEPVSSSVLIYLRSGVRFFRESAKRYFSPFRSSIKKRTPDVRLLRNLNYSDAGEYTCVATNILGSANGSGDLSVRGLPIFKKVPSSLVTPTELSTLRETCEAVGFPIPVLKWNRIRLPLPVGKTEVRGGSLTMFLRVGTRSFRCSSRRKTWTVVIYINEPSKSFQYVDDTTLAEVVPKGTTSTVQEAIAEVLNVVNCDCWRSSSRSSSRTWHHKGPVDAIDFQTNGDVILRGYRLWGVSSGSTSFQVTIRLYRGSNLLAEKTGSYPTSYSVKTFEVLFSHGILIRAGVTYTATSKVTTSSRSFAHNDGVTSASCSGVTVTFASKSSRDTNGSSRSQGQIPALTFR